jgi:hypothetical protein
MALLDPTELPVMLMTNAQACIHRRGVIVPMISGLRTEKFGDFEQGMLV